MKKRDTKKERKGKGKDGRRKKKRERKRREEKRGRRRRNEASGGTAEFLVESSSTRGFAASGARVDSESSRTNALESEASGAGTSDQLQVSPVQDQADRLGSVEAALGEE